MKKKNHGLFFLTGVLLCCSLFLGIRGMTMAFDRSGEMTEVNKISWTLHPCDIGNRFANITYNGEFRVFLADGVVDYAGGSEDGYPITRTGETIESGAGDAKLEQLYLRSSRIGKDGHKRFGCLRYDGSIAIPFEYDGLEGFVGDYCIAWKAPELLIIDKDNRVVYRTPDSSNLTRRSLHSFLVVRDGKKEVVKLGTEGKQDRTNPQAVGIEDGLMVFESKGKYGLADQEGEILIKAVFDDLQLAGDRYLIGVYRGRYGIGLDGGLSC